jgi:hypothetical protein
MPCEREYEMASATLPKKGIQPGRSADPDALRPKALRPDRKTAWLSVRFKVSVTAPLPVSSLLRAKVRSKARL